MKGGMCLLRVNDAVYPELGNLFVPLRPAYDVVSVRIPNHVVWGKNILCAAVLFNALLVRRVLQILKRHREIVVDSGVQQIYRVINRFIIGTSAICIVLLLLQMFGGVDLRENFLVIHIMIAVGAAIIIGNVIYDRLKYPQNQENMFNKKELLILVVGILADIVAYYVKGNSSSLLFSLLAMLLYILFTGIKMMLRYPVADESQRP